MSRTALLSSIALCTLVWSGGAYAQTASQTPPTTEPPPEASVDPEPVQPVETPAPGSNVEDGGGGYNHRVAHRPKRLCIHKSARDSWPRNTCPNSVSQHRIHSQPAAAVRAGAEPKRHRRRRQRGARDAEPSRSGRNTQPGSLKRSAPAPFECFRRRRHQPDPAEHRRQHRDHLGRRVGRLRFGRHVRRGELHHPQEF